MNNEIPTRDFVLDYSASSVKDALSHVFTSITNGGFTLITKESNPLLGLYSLSVFKGDSIAGLITGNISITVTGIDGNKTKIQVSGIATGTNVLGARKIQEIQNNILKNATNVLTGEFDAQKEIEANTGCLGVILIIIVMSTLLVMSLS